MTAAGLTSGDALTTVLRHCDGSGAMPQQPSDFVFYAADLKRISDWLDEGAPQPTN
jgi:hypothetical protein